MMHCAGGVILEDNILLKHSLKVDLRERSWLFYFLSVVARLVLHTESQGPLWAAGIISAPCLRLLPGCVYERKGGRQRENHSSHSGWRARTSNVPATPRAPFSPLAFPQVCLMAGSCGPALWLWPQSVSLNHNWKWARHLPLWIHICELALLWEICTCVPPFKIKGRDFSPTAKII